MTAVAPGDKPLTFRHPDGRHHGAVISIAVKAAGCARISRPTGKGQYVDLSMQTSDLAHQNRPEHAPTSRGVLRSCRAATAASSSKAMRAAALATLGFAASRAGPLPLTRDQACRTLFPTHPDGAPVLTVSESRLTTRIRAIAPCGSRCGRTASIGQC